jgi:hypothetical protein
MGRKRTYSNEELVEAIKNSESVAGVLRLLGIRPAGGSHSHISRRIKLLGLDTSHFTGSAGSSKGSKHRGGPEKKTWQQVLKLRCNERREKTFRLRRALLESGVPHICCKCAQKPEWLGKPLVLEVNHKNGNNVDDRRENLEFLCPNCHSQIPNHARVLEQVDN